jgi:hypothetical protein
MDFTIRMRTIRMRISTRPCDPGQRISVSLVARMLRAFAAPPPSREHRRAAPIWDATTWERRSSRVRCARPTKNRSIDLIRQPRSTPPWPRVRVPRDEISVGQRPVPSPMCSAAKTSFRSICCRNSRRRRNAADPARPIGLRGFRAAKAKSARGASISPAGAPNRAARDDS